MRTKLRKSQYENNNSGYYSASAVTHDYSTLGTGAKHINNGTSDFQVSVTLEETSDVLIEWSIYYNNSNAYGCHFYLYRDATKLHQFVDAGKHDQEISGSTFTFSFVDEDVPAGTYVYELYAGASGSTSTTVTFYQKCITATEVDSK